MEHLRDSYPDLDDFAINLFAQYKTHPQQAFTLNIYSYAFIKHTMHDLNNIVITKLVI